MRPKVLVRTLEFYCIVPLFIVLMNLTTTWGGPLEEGKQYEAQHLYYQAAEEYKKIDDPELRELKLNHLWNGWSGLNGQIIQAQENVSKNQNSPEARYQLADKYYQKGVALVTYQRENRGNYPQALIEAEKNFFLNAAVSESTEALRLNENYPQARLLLGKVYLTQGKKSEAIQEINQALTINPDYKEGYWILAQLYIADKLYNQAEADLIKFIRLSPDDMTAHSLLGTIYFERKDFDKAISEFDKAVKTNPSDMGAITLLARAYNAYGKNLLRKGKYEQAVVAFQKAFQLRPLKEYYDDLQTARGKQQEVRLANLSRQKMASEEPKEVSKPKEKKSRVQKSKAQASMRKKKKKSPTAQPAETTQPSVTSLPASGQPAGQPPMEKPMEREQPAAQSPLETPMESEQPAVQPLPQAPAEAAQPAEQPQLSSEQPLSIIPGTAEQPESEQPAQSEQTPQGEPQE